LSRAPRFHIKMRMPANRRGRDGNIVIEAAIKALEQMFSPPFRSVLIKSVLLALLIVALFGLGLHRLLAWLAVNGGAYAEDWLGAPWHGPLNILLWLVSILAGLGIIVGGIFVMPAVSAFVGSFFVDEIAEQVERAHYPADVPGRALPLGRAIIEGIKTALLALLVYLCALPFLLVAGLGLVALFLASAYLLSREYFELAAMRFRDPGEAKAMRKANVGRVFAAGLLIAAFVSIPIVNLAAPLFGMALMVHIHKQLSRRAELIANPSS
jgi:CysZ protein